MRTRAGGIVIKDGKILLVRRFKNGEIYHVTPGGGVEEGETPEEAVVREVMEEASIKVVMKEKLTEFTAVYAGEEAIHQLFYCEYVSGTPALSKGSVEEAKTTENNKYEPMWVNLSELNSIRIKSKEIEKFVLSFCEKFV